MIDTDKYEGHTEGKWKLHYDDSAVDGDYLDYGAQLDPVGALHPMLIADAQLIADAPLLLEEVKQAREIVPKLSRLIGVEIPWIEHDLPEFNDVFVADAVEYDYDNSGEWVLVNYNETRWVTMSYIEAHNVSKYREQVGLKEMIE